ncbi:CGNR zinc finger domain-containing protein [Streptomyces sp. NPDC007164]|uniref:CGNR zinc finger domain-containing protein n=1 Tax=Streptomyces sp. NPDC007164 TaxID=3156918 RepID=UPI0033CF6CAD
MAGPTCTTAPPAPTQPLISAPSPQPDSPTSCVPPALNGWGGARHDCGLAFVDTSRDGRRVYCSVRCANNDAVARHGERRHDEDRPSTARKTRRT